MGSQELRAGIRVTAVVLIGLFLSATLVNATEHPESLLADLAGMLATVGLVGLGAFLLYHHKHGWNFFRVYPHLGMQRARAWARAGAKTTQLELLDQLHGEMASSRVHPEWPGKVTQPLTDAHAILGSPAWRDPWLRDHRLIIDPIFEATEIIRYVHSVSSMLHEVEDAARGLPPGTASSQQYAIYSKALRDSLGTARTRAVALHGYRQQVRRLELILQDQHRLPQATALGDRVMGVVAESARHEVHAQLLRQNTQQLAMIEQGLREITTILGSDSLHVPFMEKNW